MCVVTVSRFLMEREDKGKPQKQHSREKGRTTTTDMTIRQTPLHCNDAMVDC